MSPDLLQVLWPYGIFIVLLVVIGFYCIFATFNLIRLLIGVELLLKAVTLLIVTVGYVTQHTVMTQALAITFIVIEVVMMTIAVGVVLRIRGYSNSLDVRSIKNVKG